MAVGIVVCGLWTVAAEPIHWWTAKPSVDSYLLTTKLSYNNSVRALFKASMTTLGKLEPSIKKVLESTQETLSEAQLREKWCNFPPVISNQLAATCLKYARMLRQQWSVMDAGTRHHLPHAFHYSQAWKQLNKYLIMCRQLHRYLILVFDIQQAASEMTNVLEFASLHLSPDELLKPIAMRRCPTWLANFVHCPGCSCMLDDAWTPVPASITLHCCPGFCPSIF